MHTITRFFLVGITLALAGCQPPASRQDGAKTEAAKPVAKDAAPAAGLVEWGGAKRLVATDLKGRDVLVYVFAPWTDHGQTAGAWLDEVAGAGIAVLPVAVDRSGKGGDLDLSSLSKHGPYVAEPGFTDSFGGIRALPTAVWVNRDGRMVTNWTGHVPPATVVQAMQAATARP